MWTPDPLELAEWQLARDRARAADFAGLFERKVARMLPSPVAYLRGSAPLFYRLLGEHPELRSGPDDSGWICGDAHLENFGAFRVDPGPNDAHRAGNHVVFDVNDFDEALVAPFRFDVLRLSTSLILSARQLGESGQSAVSLAATLVEAYAAAAGNEKATLSPEPSPVTALVQRALRRSHRDLLEARTTLVDGQRRFVRGPRYADLKEPWASGAVEAFQRFVQSLPEANHPERFEVLDIAFRIAGTGSLGSLRIAVLTRGKSDDDAGWLFDMKEQGVPAGVPLGASPVADPAERVATAIRTCLVHPPRMIGTTSIGDTSLFVRRLAPQEDKLNFAALEQRDLEPVARYFGTLLANAHRRGAASPPSPWTAAAQREIVDHAIVLAGIHEASYLALCKTVARGALHP